jgi:hypothetical protein
VHYQIRKKYRDRSAKEILEERNIALQIYDWLESDDNLDKKDKGV